MKAARRRRKRIFRNVRTNFLVLLAFMVIGMVCYHILRVDLLKNAKELGTSLAKTYAAEERNNLTVYETLIAFGTEAIDWRLQENADQEEMQSWISMYFQRLQDVQGERVVDPYVVLNGEILAANPWEGMERYDVENAVWYRGALMAGGDVIFTNVYTDAVYGTPVITVAQKCRNSDAVLAFDIFLEDFQFRSSMLDLPEDASFYLCDTEGNLIYFQTAMSYEQEALEPYVEDLQKRIWSGELEAYDTHVVDLAGELRSVYYSSMPNGWLSIITIPYDTILADLQQAKAVFIIVYLFSLLSVGFLTWREVRLGIRMEQTNETVTVLGNSYYALYRVDVLRGTYEIIKGSKEAVQSLPAHGRYQDLIRMAGEVMEEDAYQEYMEGFSLANVQKLVEQGVREFGGDFRRRFGTEYRWVNMCILFDKTLEEGEAVLSFREVDQEKRRQLEERKLLENALESSRKSEKAKQAFFSNMSHDMRTPLNAIIGLTDVAKKHVREPERVRDYLEKITDSGRQLLGLINDILDMSRLEQGKVVLDDRQFDLQVCIESCAAPFRVQAEEEEKHFFTSFEIRSAMVLGDPFRISQIMNNLLSNAFKFTQKGDTVAVEVKQLSFQEQIKYQIVVRDTGLGMSKEFLPKIFEPYARETRFSAGQVMGTGLGMPIVKNLVTQMSGQIQVESELGKGTVFTVELPFQSAEQEEHPCGGTLDNPISLEGKHILLAEDNAVNMEIATELLSMNGMKVTQAWDGQEAVECFATSLPYTFDAILMDMQMPKLDGCTAAQQIRALSRSDAATVPIIAVTANAFAEDVAATTAAGMDAHISKPIDFAALCCTLGRLIGRVGKD